MAEVKQGDGWIAFAVILGFMAGTWNALQGFISLLFKEAYPPDGLIFLTMQQWGFVLIIFGILQVVAAFMVSGRKNSGRLFAIVLAALGILAWAPYLGQLTFGGLTALVLNILVIYGLSVTREQFS